MLRTSLFKLAATVGIVAGAAAMGPAGAAVISTAAGTATQAAPVALELAAFRGGQKFIPHGGGHAAPGGFARGPVARGFGGVGRGSVAGSFARGPAPGGFGHGQRAWGDRQFAGHRGRGVAPFLGALGAGIAVGALANPYYGSPDYGPDYGYTAPDDSYSAEPAYVGVAPEDSVAYCMQQFKSYDPASGTYLGYDGLRHPCP